MNNDHESVRNFVNGADHKAHVPRYPTNKFIAQSRQAARLQERRLTTLKQVLVCGKPFYVLAGVYDTGLDTELMVDAVRISRSELFLEIGCGTGAASVLIAQRAKLGIGVDINPIAIENSVRNARLHAVENVKFIESDLFQAVRDKFDVIVCNPPYSCYPAKDVIDMMFWDPQDQMKRRLFCEVRSHLKPHGRLYFGWADFKDLDYSLPQRLAQQHGLSLRCIKERISPSGAYRFKVIEFQNTPVSRNHSH